MLVGDYEMDLQRGEIRGRRGEEGEGGGRRSSACGRGLVGRRGAGAGSGLCLWLWLSVSALTKLRDIHERGWDSRMARGRGRGAEEGRDGAGRKGVGCKARRGLDCGPGLDWGCSGAGAGGRRRLKKV